MTSEQDLGELRVIGRLLDQAIALADAEGDTLLAAHIAQAAQCLDMRIARRLSGQNDPDGSGTADGGLPGC